jgi:hypothetical protein
VVNKGPAGAVGVGYGVQHRRQQVEDAAEVRGEEADERGVRRDHLCDAGLRVDLLRHDGQKLQRHRSSAAVVAAPAYLPRWQLPLTFCLLPVLSLPPAVVRV